MTVIGKYTMNENAQINNWIGISRVPQVADLEILERREIKRRKQMLWKCGSKRFGK